MLKQKITILLKTFGVSAVCLMIFVSVGYYYLGFTFRPAETKQEEVPYRQYPESCGLLFEIGESKTLFYMDFEEEVLSVINADGISQKATDIYGYTVDYVLKSDYRIIEGVVDLVGGIDLNSEEGMLNYTGVQVTERLGNTVENEELRYEITKKIVNGIAERGFSLEDFLFLIENSETDLTLPECYFWPEYIKEICKNARFVD